MADAARAPQVRRESEAPRRHPAQATPRLAPPPSPLVRLQRQAGNIGVHRLLRSPAIQPALTVGPADDEFEREADRVADTVMRMPDPTVRPRHQAAPVVQRACAACEEESRRSLMRMPRAREGVQPKCASCEAAAHEPGGDGHIQRACAACEAHEGEDEDHGHVQAKSEDGQVPRVSAGLASYLSSIRGGGQPLPLSARAFFEPRFAQRFDHVRVHADSRAAEASEQIAARAFTSGHDVFFGRGEYAPASSSGRRLLAHELTHVIQQAPVRAPREDATARQSAGPSDEATPASSARVTLAAPAMLSRGEKWDAIWGVGPWDAYKASKLAEKALAAAKKTGLPGLHNGPADAWRHCYWNCLMTDEIGRDQAKFVADNHEEHGSGPAVENLMDRRNNWEGRACGGSDCDNCCQTKLDSGTLDVIESGKMVSSKKTARAGSKQSDKY